MWSGWRTRDTYVYEKKAKKFKADKGKLHIQYVNKEFVKGSKRGKKGNIVKLKKHEKGEIEDIIYIRTNSKKK